VIATLSFDGSASYFAFSGGLELIIAGDAGGHVHFLYLQQVRSRN